MSYLTKGVLLVAMAFPAQAHHHHVVPGCSKTFTVQMAQRAAKAVYSGTRHVSREERRMLGRIERCQRNPQAKHYVAWYEKHRRALWLDRFPPPVPPISALAACIIQHESGGNPYAVNGQYHGIGQWSHWSWMYYSHGRYGSDPLDATYSEQVAVLMSEGTAGMINQQARYDGC